jgi:tetratricopeptide (TPR) repeat protein
MERSVNITRMTRFLALITGSALLLCVPGATPASARQQTPVSDQIALVNLTASQAGPRSRPGTLRFEAKLNYRLQTASRGSLLLFLFENDSETSTQQSSERVPVPGGTGEMTLNIDYEPGPDIRTLSLLVALFGEDERLLTWVATNPFSLAPWPGRAAFEDAMVARLAGDHPKALEHLSRAIELSPETGNYYYWRADTLIRLGRHDSALADYTRALELMPQDRASRVGRAVALLWKNDARGTIHDATIVIENSPRPDRWTAWAHRARGVAYSRLGQRSEAIADYEAYLSLVPDAPDRAEVETWIAGLR